jgi:hypothetical protein
MFSSETHLLGLGTQNAPLRTAPLAGGNDSVLNDEHMRQARGHLS